MPETAYTPKPATRKALMELYMEDLVTDRTPLETLTRMCWHACMEDFNGSVSTAQNIAVMTFMAEFFANITLEVQDALGPRAVHM
tara:strand:+ start:1089 stop:1343 length:255 start_codon:yes stop_codon:yes gene_type:complete